MIESYITVDSYNYSDPEVFFSTLQRLSMEKKEMHGQQILISVLISVTSIGLLGEQQLLLLLKNMKEFIAF